jgi:hypothetical protein
MAKFSKAGALRAKAKWVGHEAGMMMKLKPLAGASL